ncbi:MAG: DUF4338 domain-containing protein [Armatimonadetes bacterium]|nr:DUF4338 domain-containing protein [Armatimonadota bacterium]
MERILPWVQVKNLASKILSLAAQKLPEDWGKTYGTGRRLLETFVEKDRTRTKDNVVGHYRSFFDNGQTGKGTPARLERESKIMGAVPLKSQRFPNAHPDALR